MIALGVRYLTGYAVATDLARQSAEWPPHPGRIFLAMAAAHFETGADPAERVALEWLESAGAPALRASPARERSLVRTYVPVNDEHGGILRRLRQERAFPRVRPDEDCVFLIWSQTPSAEVRASLAALCRKVTRVGHSSSAVQMWVAPEGEEPEPTHYPGAGLGELTLRVPSEGTMQQLVEAFNGAAIEQYDALVEAISKAEGREKTRLRQELAARFGKQRPVSRRPQLSHWERYGRREAEPAEGIVEGPFDSDFLVLVKCDGPALGLEPTLDLTGALRNAAMKAAGANPPEWLTGHTAEGSPSRKPHAAFFPLPYVGGEWGDGHVMGLGLALPRGLDPEELRRALGPLFFDAASGEEREIRLWNRHWTSTVKRQQDAAPPVALRRETWTGPAQTWASVTPVVLHHYPKKNRDGDVERIVREAFASAGFPEPEEVAARSVSAWRGAGAAMSLPAFPEGGEALCRYQTHVWARFAQPVRGPMLVGRGRFRGYGLLRPLEGVLRK